jgi:hypothetical protein
MKKFLASLVVIFSISCSTSNPAVNNVDKSKPYIMISLSFNTESYPKLLGKKIYPQIAVWAQEKSSGYLKTIYVSEKGAKSDWFGAKERPDAMPVWYGVVKEEKKSGVSGTANVDSVTGATPSGESFTIYCQAPESLSNKKIALYLEANVSFDYNEYYKKDLPKDLPSYNGVNGQPSMIWMSEIDLGGADKEYDPQIIGSGHVLGKDHAIDKNISHVTTAKGLFKYIKFSYSAGRSEK